MSQDQDAGADAQPPMMTTMQEAAVMTHEVFVTLQQAGFNHDEAFQLVSNLLLHMMTVGIAQSNAGG